MKVVVDGLIYESSSPGGIARLYSEILPRMCAMDDELHVDLLISGEPIQRLPVHQRIRQCSFPALDHFFRPSLIWRSARWQIRSMMQRVCLSNTPKQLWHSTYNTLQERWDGPVVVTVYDMLHERFPELFRGAGAGVLRRQKRHCVLAADAVICISETTRLDLKEFYGIQTEKVRVAPLGYSAVFRPLTDEEESAVRLIDPFLLYVGSRIHYKNFIGLLRAYRDWPGHQEINLVVVGGNWSRAERRYLVDWGIADRVHLLGRLNDQELCKLYNRAVAFVYPSLYEGFGIPLLEGMACGCPIIASRIPSTVEVAGECPIYFDVAEEASLITAFEQALSAGRDSARVRLGLERAASYSWDNTARQTLDVYRAVSNSQ